MFLVYGFPKGTSAIHYPQVAGKYLLSTYHVLGVVWTMKGNQWLLQLMTPCPPSAPPFTPPSGAGMRLCSLPTAISKNPKLMDNKADLKCYSICPGTWTVHSVWGIEYSRFIHRGQGLLNTIKGKQSGDPSSFGVSSEGENL